MMMFAAVIPVYNDTSALLELLERLFAVSSAQAMEVQVILVDDGSRQEVWLELRHLRSHFGNRNIRLVRLAHNHGQYMATLCGLLYCEADYVVTLDADLQHPPEEIPRLLTTLLEHDLDLVYGVATTGHNLFRRSLSAMRRYLVSPLGTSLPHASSFRAMKRTLVQQLAENINEKVFSLDECLSWHTRSVARVSVSHHRRRHSRSSYTFTKLAWVGLKAAYHSRHLRRGTMTLGTGLQVLALTAAARGGYGAALGLCLGGAAVIAVGHLARRKRADVPLSRQLEVECVEPDSAGS